MRVADAYVQTMLQGFVELHPERYRYWNNPFKAEKCDRLPRALRLSCVVGTVGDAPRRTWNHIAGVDHLRSVGAELRGRY